MKENEISIKVNIADVTFPMKVTMHEEETVRKAAKLINETVREFKENYHIQDKINLLSMSALQLATELTRFNSKQWVEDEGLNEKADEINLMLKNALKNL